MNRIALWIISLSLIFFGIACGGDEKSYLQISGIYPHLAAFNQPEEEAARINHRESGIGAVVPWAGKLWYITYPPHMRQGSNDKLHEVDTALNLTIRPESVGGTHANRFIHRPSNQLVIGPYFIDAEGKVRAVDVQQMEGRMTATAEHLTDPENKVLFYDMEGRVYEVDVHTLAVNLLFEKPVPGWHGKGAYTAQGRFVIANNGEFEAASHNYDPLLVGGPSTSYEEAGALAEWDGDTWRIIERKKFTDVTGPGGLYGSPGPESPLWTMGWDRRSVLLKVLDGGKWSTYRMPKGSHTFDPRHGWYTEWPRIRQIEDGRYMMVMHGAMYDFPGTFSASNTAGIRPIATHLRYIPDFAHWNGRVVLASDDASFLQNPMVGQAQSNLWFGKAEELRTFGPRLGWGGPWLNDDVAAGATSTAFLIAGYRHRILHLTHDAGVPVSVILETDATGRGDWVVQDTVDVPASGYAYKLIPADMKVEWMRLVADRAAQMTAYFHLAGPRWTISGEEHLFDGLASVEDADDAFTAAVIRPAGHNRSLQLVELLASGAGAQYHEVNLDVAGQHLVFDQKEEGRQSEVLDVAALPDAPFEVGAASVIVTDETGQRYRLPKGHAGYDKAWETGWPRAIREAVSERYLANIHGTFYEIPRVEGASAHGIDVQKIKPVSSHAKRIVDFCTWRGLLVLSGVRKDAKEDGQVFMDSNGTGLWFGMIDDLWKLGKPVGQGGPWFETSVKVGEVSDPYLMTGYDQKTLTLSHTGPEPVVFDVEVAINHEQWVLYSSFEVLPGQPVVHQFEQGYQAHWVRVRSSQATTASVQLIYE